MGAAADLHQLVAELELGSGALERVDFACFRTGADYRSVGGMEGDCGDFATLAPGARAAPVHTSDYTGLHLATLGSARNCTGK